MDKNQVKKALEALRKELKERKFKQSVDLIINLKDLDLKKTDTLFDLFLALPHATGKKVKVCAFAGAELTPQAKKECDFTINNEDFVKYQGDKKGIKKLSNQYDYFIAQANVMADAAKVFGSVLGPRKKMPNPKAGCVVPPNANLKLLVEKLQKTVRVSIKTDLAVKVKVGNQDLSDDQIADNAVLVYNTAIQNLPSDKNNVKNIMLKFTMSKPVKVQ